VLINPPDEELTIKSREIRVAISSRPARISSTI